MASDATARLWPDADHDGEADSGLTPSERDRKIFIGGLSWMTTEDTLLAYFRRIGVDIDRVVIMREKSTGRSRGFGFVIVTDIGSVDKVVGGTHVVDGKKIEAKKAIPKAEMNNPSRKIFVGGVGLNVEDGPFRAYFESFGRVVEAQIIRDRATGRSRGFGFVTFHDENAVDAVVNSKHAIQGKEVEVKMAEPRKQQPIVHHVIQPVLVPSNMQHANPYALPGFPGIQFMLPGMMPGMPMPHLQQAPQNGMPIPIPLPSHFMNPYSQMGREPFPFPPSPSMMQQPVSPRQAFPIVTEEERELLEQLRARKRQSEQPPPPKQQIDSSYSPPSIRKRKSLSDDPRKRTQARLRVSRDGETDDLDLNALRLDGYDGPDDGMSPRSPARPYPEIVVNIASPSRSSTPGSHSASTSTPMWSESEQRLTPPSPHMMFHDPHEEVSEEAAIVYGFNSSISIPPRPASSSSIHLPEEHSPGKGADWSFNRPDSPAASVGHQRQRSTGSSIDFSARSPFPNLSTPTPAHARARSQDVSQFVSPNSSTHPLSQHFRVHSTGAW